MKLQCLIKSRYPGAYNREVDFGEHGIVKIVDGIADVGHELAAYMVASGNFVRIEDAVQVAQRSDPVKRKSAKPKFTSIEPVEVTP
jgi:hypothetical protein